jgi:ADP-L-glycero-D-manno-heptose 6-epimerase
MSVPGKNAVWRVLVTGGAGFIGSNLVRRIEMEWPQSEVTVVDDFRSGDFRNLRGFRGDLITADLSVMDFGAYFKPREFDAIFHLASITDTRVTDQAHMCRDNIESFRNLLEFAQASKVPVTYASSAATYGLSEGANAETDDRRPANVYGFSKAQLENLAERLLRQPDNSGWKVNAVRYFNVYGPGEAHKGPMASMAYQLYVQMRSGARPRVFRAGEQKRDFVHVDDAVECTLLAMHSGRPGVFNTGSGQARSFNELIAQLNKAMGTALEPEYVENPYPFFQPHTQADLTRSNEVLGYQPKYDLEQGIFRYVDWLKSQES